MARHGKLNTPQKRARVGERIKIAATQAGITLKELAEQAGTSPSLIYQYVRGIIAVPEPTLVRIAEVTRVHPDYFDPDTDARTALALPADASSDGSAATGVPEPGTRARIYSQLRQLHTLAEAQKFPRRDRTAYMSSLDQMLVLSRTVENKQQEAWALWMLGCARIEDNRLDDAKRDILAARKLFADEGLDHYRALATLDLAVALTEQGSFDAAMEYLDETLKNENPNVRWRASLTLGALRYRQHKFEAALRSFMDAAELLGQVPIEQREREGMPLIMSHVADVVRATGHYEEAMMLWGRCLQQAAEERKADAFLEAIMEIAQCCYTMGRIGEAKQRLELAVVLASFLFEDEARLSIARALLAEVQLAMGALDQARESARLAVRVADRVGMARASILAALTSAEVSLAAGQWGDALSSAQEALDGARRTRRTREVSRAREIRARSRIREAEERMREGKPEDAARALGAAYSESSEALEVATQSESVQEQVTAHITIARCLLMQGDEEGAQREAQAAVALTEGGAVGLSTLLGADTSRASSVLAALDINVDEAFAGRKLALPVLEWQAHYLSGTIQARAIGPAAAYDAMRDAATVLNQITSGLTPAEAAGFRSRHPEAAAVFQDLAKYAITDGQREESRRLLQGAPWAAPEAAQHALAAAD